MSTPALTLYGINSLKVIVVNPVIVGSDAMATVNNIGSVSASNCAFPPPLTFTVND